jgi:putative peptidoglycan lipid II flippase
MSRLRAIPTLAVFRSATLFGLMSLLAKLLGLAKEVVIASRFGASHVLDIYFMGMVLIVVPVSVLMVALQATMIPQLVGKDNASAARLLGGALKFATAMLLVALPVWLAVLPVAVEYLHPRSDPAHIDQLYRTCLWLIPYYFLGGLNWLLYGALQARKIFWANAMLPGVFHLTIMAALLLSTQADAKLLLAGTAIGTLLESMVLVAILRQSGLLALRNTSGAGLMKVMKPALPLMVGGMVYCFAPAIEQMLAYRLGTGSVSMLNYGNKLPSSLYGLLATAVSVVILPYFAQLNASQNWRSSRKLFFQVGFVLAAGGLVGASLGAWYAEPIVRLAFERGAFTPTMSSEAAALMQIYLMQLPFALVTMVSYRALTALGDTKTLTASAVMQVLGAAVLGYWLSTAMGVRGIVWASLIASAVVAFGAFAVTWWRFGLRIRSTVVEANPVKSI